MAKNASDNFPKEDDTRQVSDEEAYAFICGQLAFIVDYAENISDWAVVNFGNGCPEVQLSLNQWRKMREGVFDAIVSLWNENLDRRFIQHDIVWRKDNDYPFRKPLLDEYWPATEEIPESHEC